MKRKILSLVAVAATTLVLGTGYAGATTISGTGLQGTLNAITTAPTAGTSSVDVHTDQLTDLQDSYWSITASGGSVATFIISLSSNSTNNTVGIFDNGSMVDIFNGGSAAAGDHALISIKMDGSVYKNFADTGVDFNKNYFGFYLDTGSSVFYSDSSLNPDMVDAMVAFQGTGTDTVQIGTNAPGTWTDNEFVLAFEDGIDRDGDYDDLVLMMESIEVPEPGTLALVGSGLIGFAVAARKRRRG